MIVESDFPGPAGQTALDHGTKSSSLDDLYQTLAEEIPSESERKQFLESKNRLH